MDEDVFEIQPRLAAKRRECVEEEREADQRTFRLGDDRLSERTGAEQMLAKIVGRGAGLVFHRLIDCQLADQVHDRLAVFRLGSTNFERPGPPFCCLHVFVHQFSISFRGNDPEISAIAIVRPSAKNLFQTCPELQSVRDLPTTIPRMTRRPAMRYDRYLLQPGSAPMIGSHMLLIRPDSRRSRYARLTSLTRFTVLTTALALSGSQARAQAVSKTPLPEFTGSRVTVAEVPDRYPDLAKQIDQVEKATGASFYVAAIRSSGRGDNATRTYVDDLFRAWSKSPAGKTSKFDPDRSVLIVVALENRQIATHAGPELRDRFGLTASTIRSEIVEPRFIPLAKELKYDEAMASLLDGFREKMAGVKPPGSPANPTVDRGIVDSLPPAEISKLAPSTSPTSRTMGSQMLWALLASLAAVVAIVFGLIWLGKRLSPPLIPSSCKRRSSGQECGCLFAPSRLCGLTCSMHTSPQFWSLRAFVVRFRECCQSCICESGPWP